MRTFEEHLTAADLPPEQLEKVRRAVEFVRGLGVVCTGSSVRETCDWPPLQVILFHGRPLAVNCVECHNVNGAMIIGMGHGAFTTEGVLAFEKSNSGPKLKALSEAILKGPIREVTKGRYHKPAQEKKWRASLVQYRETNS